MSDRITVEELAELMKKAAGVTVAPDELQRRSDSGFDSFGLDSLGLLGIVGALENEYGATIPADADACRTPAELLALVNDVLKARA